MKTVQLLIKGKVQGVFYRATAKDVADKLGLKGWVRNTKEGDVEVLVTGDEEQLKQFIDWCWKGPSSAKVTDVIITEKALEIFEKFSVQRGSIF
jgi:acylphosphatase